MKHFSGDSVVLTDCGCKTIKDLYNNGNYTENDIYIIINGEKYKCNKIEYCGTLQLAKVSFRNGMDIFVDPDQEFIDNKGNSIPIELAKSTNNNNKHVNIALNNINLFVWDNSFGTYNEGYIISLLTHNSSIFTTYDGISCMYVSIKISKKITNIETYYPYELLVDYFKELNMKLDICVHMETCDWIIYRFKSPYFRTLLSKFGMSYNIKHIFEKGSYDFSQGYLRGIFDMEAEVFLYDNHQESIIRIFKQDLEYLKALQRLLFNLGIPCRIQNNYLIIKSMIDIYKFNFVIGFGVEDKNIKLTLSKSNSPIHTNTHIHKQSSLHHYWSYINEVTENKRRLEAYKLEVDGDIIAINGILVKS
jgi:hypothetical protein